MRDDTVSSHKLRRGRIFTVAQITPDIASNRHRQTCPALIKPSIGSQDQLSDGKKRHVGLGHFVSLDNMRTERK